MGASVISVISFHGAISFQASHELPVGHLLAGDPLLRSLLRATAAPGGRSEEPERNPNGTRTEPERNPNSRDGSLAGGGFCSWKPWEEHGKTDHPANMQLTCKVISSALVCVAFNPFRTLELPMNSMGYCYEQLTICSLGGWRIEWSSLIGVQ